MHRSSFAVGVLGFVLGACAHAEPQESTLPPAGDADGVDVDTVAVRRENQALRRRVQMLEDRVLRLEHILDAGRSAKKAPSVPAQTLTASTGREPAPPVPAQVRPRRGTKSISLGSPTPSPEQEAQAAWDEDSDAHPFGLDEVDEVVVADAAGAESAPQRYRLVGSRLVELTQTKPPAPPPSAPRGKKARSVKGRYDAAMTLYRERRFEAAERAFEALARDEPDSDYADNALYWKGEAAYDQRHFADALASFTEVVERYGGGNKAPDALLKIGLCYDKLGDVDNAKDVLTRLVAAYPGARASDIARARLAELEVQT